MTTASVTREHGRPRCLTWGRFFLNLQTTRLLAIDRGDRESAEIAAMLVRVAIPQIADGEHKRVQPVLESLPYLLADVVAA